jgi:hypothetical protein
MINSFLEHLTVYEKLPLLAITFYQPQRIQIKFSDNVLNFTAIKPAGPKWEKAFRERLSQNTVIANDE